MQNFLLLGTLHPQLSVNCNCHTLRGTKTGYPKETKKKTP